MSTALLTGNELKRIILEETDKVHIEKETDLFFEALFDLGTNVTDTIQKLEEIATNSYNRKVGMLNENAPLYAPGTLPSPMLGNPGIGSGTPISIKPPAPPTPPAPAPAVRQAGVIRSTLSRIATALGTPIRYVANAFRKVFGSLARRVLPLGLREGAKRIASSVAARLGLTGVGGAIAGAGVMALLFKLAIAGLTLYSLYQIAQPIIAAFEDPALATTDPKRLAAMRKFTVDRAKDAGRYLAGDWKNWPKEVQCAFCKQNPGREKPIKGKKRGGGYILADGPTCKEIKKDCKKQGPKRRRGCCATNTRLIKKNPDLGPNVKAGFKELKDLLKAAGFGKDLDSSGKCDRKLCNAIKAFQQAHGLSADSLYGPITHAKMQEVLKKTPLQKTLKKDADKFVKTSQARIDKRSKQLAAMQDEYNELAAMGIEPDTGMFANANEERMAQLQKNILALSNQIGASKAFRDDTKSLAKKAGV